MKGIILEPEGLIEGFLIIKPYLAIYYTRAAGQNYPLTFLFN